jgi:hypothetical protein
MCAWRKAIEVLHNWQDLVGAIVGATALIWTVRKTLSAEKRRRDEDVKSLRIALGAELRQFAANALRAHQTLVSELSQKAPPRYTNMRKAGLADCARFADPVIYPNTASSLGTLREYAYDVEMFFNQIAIVRDGVRRINQDFGESELLQKGQVEEIAACLLRAVESAVKALPAFSNAPEAQHDEKFKAAVITARERLEAAKGSR